ncbi:hypothetical protein CLOM_g16638 [Closterium sp. NIES-68]|nr:hypothetical protein CLOM_g16638 [Closterium sp. NIES-68]
MSGSAGDTLGRGFPADLDDFQHQAVWLNAKAAADAVEEVLPKDNQRQPMKHGGGRGSAAGAAKGVAAGRTDGARWRSDGRPPVVIARLLGNDAADDKVNIYDVQMEVDADETPYVGDDDFTEKRLEDFFRRRPRGRHSRPHAARRRRGRHSTGGCSVSVATMQWPCWKVAKHWWWCLNTRESGAGEETLLRNLLVGAIYSVRYSSVGSESS